jgi:hypothetical protein
VEGGADVHERLERVHDDAAVDAGVEVHLRAFDPDFEADEATEAGGDDDLLGAGAAGVGNEDEVGVEAVFVFFEESVEAGASDFFFAFDEVFEADGEVRVLLEGAAEGGHVDDLGALVVSCAASVEAAIADCGLEGGGGPEVEGVGRLDIIMAVDEDAGPGGVAAAFAEEDGVLGGLDGFYFEAKVEELLFGELAGVVEFVSILWVCGDAGMADVFFEGGDRIGDHGEFGSYELAS